MFTAYVFYAPSTEMVILVCGVTEKYHSVLKASPSGGTAGNQNISIYYM